MRRQVTLRRGGWLRIFGLAIILVAGTGGPALGLSYPARPIRLIVPHAAGGSNDILARIIATRLSESLGQQIVVDNRGGATAIIGTALAAKAPADGYTLLLADAPHGANPALNSKLPYDTLKDFASVSLLSLMPSVLIVHPAVPAQSVSELIALAKSRPGKLNYASAGSGSSIYLTMALFIDQTGIDVFHVAYKSGAPALTDTIGGHVQMQFVNVPPVLQHVKAGRVRALGVTSAKRAPSLPDVPTIAESGVPMFEDYQWMGVLVPAGTPREIVFKLNSEIVRVVSTSDIKERISGLGAEVVGSTPAYLDEFIKTQVARWIRVLKPRMESGK